MITRLGYKEICGLLLSLPSLPQSLLLWRGSKLLCCKLSYGKAHKGKKLKKESPANNQQGTEALTAGKEVNPANYASALGRESFPSQALR